MEILVKSSLTGPCMIQYRSLTEDVVEIPVGSFQIGPCMKILQMPCVRGGSMKLFVPRSCKILSTAAGVFMTVLWGALVEIQVKSSKRSLNDLVQVLVRRSCGDPVEIIFKRCLR